MSTAEKPVYRFAEFELDPAERRLARKGEPVTLTPKVFDTLVLLVENAGHAVSKDELMRALWPRGFVDESNLTKHIWLIRKALDAPGADAGSIETVPKLGYRFILPVSNATPVRRDDPIIDTGPEPRAERIDPPIDRTVVNVARPVAHPSPAPTQIHGGHPLSRRWLTVAGVAVALGVILFVFARVDWRPALQSPASSPSDEVGSSVAIVAFNNLSQNAKDAWLGPALGDMLGTEIAVGGQLHALPDELVRPAGADLSAPMAGGYAMQSLSALRKRLGTDYVLSGSYLVTGAGPSPPLRIDLALQDARNGREIIRFARTGTVADLPALVTQSGGLLRAKLGLPAALSGELEQLSAAQPPTTEVARAIGFALDALRHNDPARARDELLDAVAQAPGYAPAYTYLAQAWSALGYKAKALAAAEQAAAHSDGLPDDLRLQIDTQLALQKHDWVAAVRNARALVALRPKNPEFRLQLVSVLMAGGKPGDAQTELGAVLKTSPSIAEDPRFELVQARVASALGDGKGAGEHAEKALQQARRRDETGVAAEAATIAGIARADLRDNAGAEQAFKEAHGDYARIGNPHGEAWVDQSVGNLYFDNDGVRAREAYQRALTAYQSIGDRNGEAAIYSNLARMLWADGDLDGAERAVRKSLAIRRETDDLAGQAWNLAALGSIQLDVAASDEAVANLQEAIALDERAGELRHRGFALLAFADLQRLRGDLVAAAATCGQALAAYRDVPDPDLDSVASARMECALVALDRGDLAQARGWSDQASAEAKPFDDKLVRINSQMVRAQIAMGQADWTSAVPLLQDVAKVAMDAGLVSGEAIAQSQLALCHAALHDSVERDRAAARARELRSRITEHQEVFVVDIALAQLLGDTGHADTSISLLRDLVADADRRQWLAWSLEGRLALWRMLERLHDPSANASRSALLSAAKARGFGWVVARLSKSHPG